MRGSKCQWLDTRDDKKKESLDKFEGKGEKENIGYISLFFVTPSQKESNHLTDMSKTTKRLNYPVYIPKIG